MSSTDCTWLIDNQAPINLLNNWDDPRTTIFHTWFEEKIGNLIKDAFGSDILSLSSGYAPEWDVQYRDGTLVEIKYTSNTGKTFFVETHRIIGNRDDGSPILKESGLSLSRSHYYAVLQKSFFGKKDSDTFKEVVKVKICPTYKLRRFKTTAAIKTIAEGDRYKSYGFEFPYMEFGDNSDNWVGSFGFNSESNTIDLTDFLAFQKGTKRPNLIHDHDKIKNTYQ
jgi:hypothetical protein